MRVLIKKILFETFIHEKAAPRRMAQNKDTDDIGGYDYLKGNTIHSMVVGDDGKVHIIWNDDLHKVEKKLKEIENLENSITNIEQRIEQYRRLRNLPPGYLNGLYRQKRSMEFTLGYLKNEIESQSIDNPLINYFDIK